MKELVGILVPLGVCVVMPIVIVWLIMRNKKNDTNRRTEIILAALEKNSDIGNMEELLKQMTPPQPTFREKMLQKLHRELIWGCIMTLTGIGVLVIITLTAKDMATGDITGFGIMGSCGLAVGISLLIAYFAGKKTLNKEVKE